MLKTLRDKQVWLVSQPDHGELAGYLAAHWGNDEFARPGYFADSADPERLRAETVLAIAQHDNGWWEWEAAPELAGVDGLPLGLTEMLKDHEEGMNRWRLGIPRLAPQHPYASLLISFHAYWLYSLGVEETRNPAFTHPLFWKGWTPQLMGDQNKAIRSFVDELREIQAKLTARLDKDSAYSGWTDGQHLHPHVRLLQLLDGLSLALCSALVPPTEGQTKGLGEDAFDLLEVPRRSWADRVTIRVRPIGDRRIVCQPYPFDVDPLPIEVPARVLDRPAEPGAGHVHLWWARVQKQPIRFEYRSE